MSEKQENPTGETKPEEKPAGFEVPDDSSGFRLAERSVWHLLQKNAEDLMILDLRGISDVCDFFVLASGTSDVHVKALGKHLRDELVDVKEKPRGVEGMDDGRWVLLDFFDVVVHVFKKDVREYFQLERLWGDARILEIAPEWFDSAEVKARHADLIPDSNR